MLRTTKVFNLFQWHAYLAASKLKLPRVSNNISSKIGTHKFLTASKELSDNEEISVLAITENNQGLPGRVFNLSNTVYTDSVEFQPKGSSNEECFLCHRWGHEKSANKVDNSILLENHKEFDRISPENLEGLRYNIFNEEKTMISDCLNYKFHEVLECLNSIIQISRCNTKLSTSRDAIKPINTNKLHINHHIFEYNHSPILYLTSEKVNNHRNPVQRSLKTSISDNHNPQSHVEDIEQRAGLPGIKSYFLRNSIPKQRKILSKLDFYQRNIQRGKNFSRVLRKLRFNIIQLLVAHLAVEYQVQIMKSDSPKLNQADLCLYFADMHFLKQYLSNGTNDVKISKRLKLSMHLTHRIVVSLANAMWKQINQYVYKGDLNSGVNLLEDLIEFCEYVLCINSVLEKSIDNLSKQDFEYQVKDVTRLNRAVNQQLKQVLFGPDQFTFEQKDNNSTHSMMQDSKVLLSQDTQSHDWSADQKLNKEKTSDLIQKYSRDNFTGPSLLLVGILYFRHALLSQSQNNIKSAKRSFEIAVHYATMATTKYNNIKTIIFTDSNDLLWKELRKACWFSWKLTDTPLRIVYASFLFKQRHVSEAKEILERGLVAVKKRYSVAGRIHNKKVYSHFSQLSYKMNSNVCRRADITQERFELYKSLANICFHINEYEHSLGSLIICLRSLWRRGMKDKDGLSYLVARILHYHLNKHQHALRCYNGAMEIITDQVAQLVKHISKMKLLLKLKQKKLSVSSSSIHLKSLKDSISREKDNLISTILSHVRILYDSGLCYMSMEMSDEAMGKKTKRSFKVIKLFQEAIQIANLGKLSPHIVAIRLSLATVLCRNNRIDQAIEQYKAALDILRNYASSFQIGENGKKVNLPMSEVHAHLANCLDIHVRDFAQADTHYRIALENSGCPDLVDLLVKIRQGAELESPLKFLNDSGNCSNNVRPAVTLDFIEKDDVNTEMHSLGQTYSAQSEELNASFRSPIQPNQNLEKSRIVTTTSSNMPMSDLRSKENQNCDLLSYESVPLKSDTISWLLESFAVCSERLCKYEDAYHALYLRLQMASYSNDLCLPVAIHIIALLEKMNKISLAEDYFQYLLNIPMEKITADEQYDITIRYARFLKETMHDYEKSIFYYHAAVSINDCDPFLLMQYIDALKYSSQSNETLYIRLLCRRVGDLITVHQELTRHSALNRQKTKKKSKKRSYPSESVDMADEEWTLEHYLYIYDELASAYHHISDFKEMEFYYNKVLSYDLAKPNSIFSSIALKYACFLASEKGNLEKAERYFFLAIEYASDHEMVKYCQGILEFHLGNYETANELFNDLVNSSNNSFQLHQWMGIVQENLTDFSKPQKKMEVARHYLQALNENVILPDQIDENAIYNQFCVATQIDAALQCVGFIYRKLGKPDIAEACYKILLAYFPQQAEVYWHLSLIYVAKNRIEEARKFFLEAYNFGRKNPNIIDSYAHFIMEYFPEQHGMCEVLYRDFIISNPTNPKGYLFYATFLASDTIFFSPSLAEMHFQKAIEYGEKTYHVISTYTSALERCLDQVAFRWGLLDQDSLKLNINPVGPDLFSQSLVSFSSKNLLISKSIEISPKSSDALDGQSVLGTAISTSASSPNDSSESSIIANSNDLPLPLDEKRKFFLRSSYRKVLALLRRCFRLSRKSRDESSAAISLAVFYSRFGLWPYAYQYVLHALHLDINNGSILYYCATLLHQRCAILSHVIDNNLNSIFDEDSSWLLEQDEVAENEEASGNGSKTLTTLGRLMTCKEDVTPVSIFGNPQFVHENNIESFDSHILFTNNVEMTESELELKITDDNLTEVSINTEFELLSKQTSELYQRALNNDISNEELLINMIRFERNITHCDEKVNYLMELYNITQLQRMNSRD